MNEKSNEGYITALWFILLSVLGLMFLFNHQQSTHRDYLYFCFDTARDQLKGKHQEEVESLSYFNSGDFSNGISKLKNAISTDPDVCSSLD